MQVIELAAREVCRLLYDMLIARTLRRGTAILTRLPADRSGASAVEFALVVPLLIALFGGIYTVGTYLRAHNTVSTYAREAARGVALGYMTDAEAKQFAETHARDDLRVAVSAAIDPHTKGNANDRDVVVTVSISQAEMARMTPFSTFIPGGVQSVVTMRSTLE